MNKLQAKTLTLDSREVAKMVDRRHGNLVRDIETYIEYLENSKMSYQDFFIESTYKAEGNNRTYKCYQITRKGCEMIANKLTGQKGVAFTAAYVNRFHEMERQLVAPIQDLSPQLQVLINMELKQKELERQLTDTRKQVTTIKDTIIQENEDWRKDVNKKLQTIGFKLGKYKEIRQESYELLEGRARCDLSTRLANYKERLRKSGASKTTINRANYLDVIGADERLKEIYIGIVNQMYVKYAA